MRPISDHSATGRLLHGMISYWHHNVVCPSVMLCIVTLRVGVQILCSSTLG